MKLILRLVAMLWPFGKLSEISRQLSAACKNYKRKQKSQRLSLPKLIADGRLLIAVLTTTVCLEARAQTPEPSGAANAGIPDTIIPLTIGDTIPDYLWHLPLQVVNHPEGRDTITLDEYRGKLIILDFWATWCSSCLEGFPKMDALQEKYGDRLAILLVNAKQTGDNMERVAKVFRQRKEKTGYEATLPYFVGEPFLQRYFRHKILPHYVWINMDGIFTASTFADEVRSANVDRMLEAGRTAMHMKKDIIGPDPGKLLFAELKREADMPVKYSSTLTGYTEGLGHSMGNGPLDQDSSMWRLYRINIPLSGLYNSVFKKEIGKLPINRLAFELPGGSDFERQYLGIARYEGLYCYELLVPSAVSDSIYGILRGELTRLFNVTVERETRNAAVFRISPGPNAAGVTAGSPHEAVMFDDDGRVSAVRSMPFRYIVRVLNNRVRVPIVPSERDSDPRIDLDIPEAIGGFSADELKSWLNGKGFAVREEQRELEFAVFKRRDNSEGEGSRQSIHGTTMHGKDL